MKTTVEIDHNNNERLPDNMMFKGNRYDSGLEISPHSTESLTFSTNDFNGNPYPSTKAFVEKVDEKILCREDEYLSNDNIIKLSLQNEKNCINQKEANLIEIHECHTNYNDNQNNNNNDNNNNNNKKDINSNNNNNNNNNNNFTRSNTFNGTPTIKPLSQEFLFASSDNVSTTVIWHDSSTVIYNQQAPIQVEGNNINARSYNCPPPPLTEQQQQQQRQYNLKNHQFVSHVKKNVFSEVLTCFRNLGLKCFPIKKGLANQESMLAESNSVCLSSSQYSDHCIKMEESETELEFGQISFDKIENMEYLNSGTEGVVYKAELNSTNIAMKKVRSIESIDIERLIKLNHSNVVRFLGISEVDKSKNYIIMEYCSHGQLYQHLQSYDKDLFCSLVISWASQICNGMTYLHSCGIIHRDLKSPNVLLTEGKVLKIIDFGVSKSLWNNDKSNSLLGTYAWMAPEVFIGKEDSCTEKVDIWSYGVIIWEMLTRKIPYDAIDPPALIYGVSEGTLSLPIPPTFPTEIVYLLNMCWNRNVKMRPSFQYIGDNFESFFQSLNRMTDKDFQFQQKEWAACVNERYESMTRSQISTSKIQEELVYQRNKELSDAREIKKLYNHKLGRAEKLITDLKNYIEVMNNQFNSQESERNLFESWRLFLRLPRNQDIERRWLDFIEPVSVGPTRTGYAEKIKKKLLQRNSMMDSTNSATTFWPVKRKCSAPITKTKSTLPFKFRLPTKVINDDRKKSISCEELGGGANSNSEGSTPKKLLNKIKRNSTSLKDTMGKIEINSQRRNGGTINPTFKCSNDSIIKENMRYKKVKMRPDSLCLNNKYSTGINNNNNNYNYNYNNYNGLPVVGVTGILNCLNYNYSSNNNSTFSSTNNLMQTSNHNSLTLSNKMVDSIEESSAELDEKGNSYEPQLECKNEVTIRIVSGRRNIQTNDTRLTDSNSLVISKDPIESMEEKTQKMLYQNEAILKMLNGRDLNYNLMPVGVRENERVINRTSFDGNNMSLWSPRHE